MAGRPLRRLRRLRAQNPTRDIHGTEFLVVLGPDLKDSVKRIYDAAREAVSLGYADGARFRSTVEGGHPALGVTFYYDILDGVTFRDSKITRTLERSGGQVVGQLHFREGEEQDRLMARYAQGRQKKAQRLLAPSSDEMQPMLVSEARKKASRSRPPKPVYTKAYLAAKGMKRRNPLDMYRKRSPDGEMYFSVSVPRSTANLDIQFSGTDWSRPGAQKTLRILPTSRGNYGVLVRDLEGRSLTADDLLMAAINAEAAADDMFNAYPRYQYRDAARYYEGLTEVLTDLAASLQKGWR